LSIISALCGIGIGIGTRLFGRYRVRIKSGKVGRSHGGVIIEQRAKIFELLQFSQTHRISRGYGRHGLLQCFVIDRFQCDGWIVLTVIVVIFEQPKAIAVAAAVQTERFSTMGDRCTSLGTGKRRGRGVKATTTASSFDALAQCIKHHDTFTERDTPVYCAVYSIQVQGATGHGRLFY
jgi:hypothetical protein